MSAFEILFRGHNALELILAGIAIVAMPTIAARLRMRVLRGPLDQSELLRRYWITVVRGWLIAVAVLLVWLAAGRPFSELGLDWPPQGEAALAFAFTIIAVIVYGYRLAFRFRPTPAEVDKLAAQLEALRLAPRNGTEFAAFVPVALTAGVWEEIFYRGFLIWFLASPLGIWGAAIVSSIIFGLGHLYQGWRGVLRTTFVGMVFSAGYIATQSLWWLILLHAAIDVYAGILSWRVFALRRAAHGR